MHKTSEIAYIGLGSNLGDRQKYLNNALNKLKNTKGIILNKISPIYETEPVGYLEQPFFLNCVAEIKTSLSPFELLNICISIENKLGRTRNIKWGPRTIDLDILFFGCLIINKEDLIIPHPRLNEREFVLIPMNDLAPNFLHPVFNLTINVLLKKLEKINSDR